MLENFSDWYRFIDKAPSSEVVKNRLDGIEAAAQQFDKFSAIEFARILLNRSEDRTILEDRIREIFREKDAAFLNRGNHLEVSLLCASILIKCWESPKALKKGVVEASLFSVVGNFGAKQNNPITEILAEISQCILDRSTRIRQREAGSRKTTSTSATTVLAEIDQALAANQQFPQLWPKIKDAILTSNKLTASMETEVSSAREEAQVAWWLIGEYSEILNLPLSKTSPMAALLPCGEELAKLSSFELPPVSAGRILIRSMNNCNEPLSSTISIRQLVTGSDCTWKENFLKKVPDDFKRNLLLFPILGQLSSDSKDTIDDPVPSEAIAQQIIWEFSALKKFG